MKIDSSLAAVVTGGASGLGLATVKALRAAGANVAMVDGSVHLLSNLTDVITLRRLVSASEQVPTEGGTFLQ